MLERPSNRRQAASSRQRRYRRRLRAGLMPVRTDIDAAVVSMLVDIGWLAEADSGDREKIGAALSAMLLNVAEKYR